MTPTAPNPIAQSEQIQRDYKREFGGAERERMERFAVSTPIEDRPDIHLSESARLHKLAKYLIRFKQCNEAHAMGEPWDINDSGDSIEIRSFAKMAADSIEPVIKAVLAAADEHERKAG